MYPRPLLITHHNKHGYDTITLTTVHLRTQTKFFDMNCHDKTLTATVTNLKMRVCAVARRYVWMYAEIQFFTHFFYRYVSKTEHTLLTPPEVSE